jgi:MOSC domain-containing protein YiiM
MQRRAPFLHKMPQFAATLFDAARDLCAPARRGMRSRGSVEPTGRLTGIFLTEVAGAEMHECDQAQALAGRGLAGDRYAEGGGFWRLTDGCQVTLIHGEHLGRAERRLGRALNAGQHRRNLVVTGLHDLDLKGKILQIGSALFEWHRPRPPCGYLDRVAGGGTAKALGRNAGFCLRVLQGGIIRRGDAVRVIEDRSAPTSVDPVAEPASPAPSRESEA